MRSGNTHRLSCRVDGGEQAKDAEGHVDRLLSSRGRACLVMQECSCKGRRQSHTYRVSGRETKTYGSRSTAVRWDRKRPLVSARGSKYSEEMPPKENAPCDGSDQADKLVEVGCADPGDQGAGDRDREPEGVLHPLDARVAFAAAHKDAVLHDAHGGEELQGRREQDRHRVQELRRVHELVVLRQVDKHDRLCDTGILLSH